MLFRVKSEKIAIIQSLIPHYRIDFFNGIAVTLKNATVFHSTKTTNDGLAQNVIFGFPNQRVPILDKIFFRYQSLVTRVINSDYKYVVLGLELRIISNLLVWFFSFFKKYKIVWWTHGYNVHLKHKNFHFFLDRIIKTILMKFSYKILLYNKYNLNELLQHGVDASKIILLNNTVNEKPHCEALRKVDLDIIREIEVNTKKSAHTLVFIGRLAWAKRADLLISLSRKLVGTFSDLRVFVIGEGSERKNLEHQVMALALEKHVFFLGAINDPILLAPYMRLANFIVLPGAVGLSIVHSMICEIPFVTLKDSPHSPEFVYLKNNINGYAAKNLDEMHDWIMDCFENPQKIEKMKANCRRMIEEDINMQNMVSQFIKAFE